LLLTGGCTADAPPPALVVFAAASTADALEELKLRYQQEHGGEIEISYGGSSHLAAQIGQGAPADLFLSASEEWADTLAARGLVAERHNLLGNELVLIVPADSQRNISTPADLTRDRVSHLALADPQAVPAGKYAREALEKLGLWQPLEKKVVAGADVRQALMYVERGEADAGIVYASDAALTSQVKVVHHFDPALSSPIRYPWVRLKDSSLEADGFYDFLRSAQATKVFQQKGFIVLH
jgi:molybdate transport system substrate-binding protein